MSTIITATASILISMFVYNETFFSSGDGVTKLFSYMVLIKTCIWYDRTSAKTL